MTLEIGILLGLLAVMVALFLTEKIPVDLTAFAGLAVLILTGYLGPDEAFSGFASSAVITMLSIFVVGGALLRTGVADVVGGWAHRLVGSDETRLIVMLMLVGGVLSAFMNNIAAVAVMMPAVSSVAKSSGIAPSRLFMPLSFGAILGGTTTLVGTPPNIVAAAMLEERGLPTFSLFDFTPMGVVLLLAGVVFMVTLGRRLLPERGKDRGLSQTRELAQAYGLQERLFTVHVARDSHMDGRTLEESMLGATLGIEVVAILRGSERIYAPGGHARLRSEDVLLVKGKPEELAELARAQDLEVRGTSARALPSLARGVGGVRAALNPDSTMVGKTLRELRFREQFELVVVGIVRGGEPKMELLGLECLAAGDEIIALGSREMIDRFATRADFEVSEVGYRALEPLADKLFLIRIPDDGRTAGQTIREGRIGERIGLTVGGLIRDGVTRLAVSPDERLRAGDQLVVAGNSWRIKGLLELGEALPEVGAPEVLGEGDETGVVEVAVAPRSRLAGKTLAELDFKARYGLQVLSIWSEGQSYRTDLTYRTLRFGDALLVQGAWEKIAGLADDPDFVVLSQNVETPRRTEKALFAVGSLLLMIGMVVSGFQPIHVAAFTAATLTVLGGALRMEEAYHVIEWRAIFLVAAVLPVGIAMERTGAALLLANVVTEMAGPYGPYAVLAALVLLSSLLSQGLDGAPAVVLLTPVVLGIATAMSLSPLTLMMGVSLAASAAFMTPFSHKANLLVMGAGGYRATDYIRVGSLLTAAVLGLIVGLVPIFFPF